MKNKTISKISLVLSMTALIVAFSATNPIKKSHKTLIKNTLQQSEKGRMISSEFSNQLRYQDFLFFSYTKFYDDIISFGIANKVFIINNLTIEIELNKEETTDERI